MSHTNHRTLLAIALAFAVSSFGCGGSDWSGDDDSDTATDEIEDSTIEDTTVEDTTEDTLTDPVEDVPEDTMTDPVEDTTEDTLTDPVEDVPEDTMTDSVEDVVEDVPADTTEEEPAPECTADGDCDDSDPCTADSCNTAAGVCEEYPMDADADSYPAASVGGTTCSGGTDCDDGDGTIHPGATEVCDLVDDDCDGTYLDAPGIDDDGDTYLDDHCGGDDCDDTDEDIYPGATILDIAQETSDDHLNMAPWQSFTPTMDGQIVSIEMRPNIYISGGGTTSGSLIVYAGEGVSGTTLHTQSYSLASAGGMPWQTFVLTTPLVVTGGTVYTWELSGITNMAHATSNVYAGGRASSSSYDMVFRVNLEVCL